MPSPAITRNEAQLAGRITLAGVVINALIGAFLAFAVFPRDPEISTIAASGHHGFASGIIFHLTLQGIWIAIVTTLFASLWVSGLARRGAVTAPQWERGDIGLLRYLPSNPLARGIMQAILLTVVIGGLTSLLMTVSGSREMTFVPFLVMSIVHAVVIGSSAAFSGAFAALGDLTEEETPGAGNRSSKISYWLFHGLAIVLVVGAVVYSIPDRQRFQEQIDQATRLVGSNPAQQAAAVEQATANWDDLFIPHGTWQSLPDHPFRFEEQVIRFTADGNYEYRKTFWEIGVDVAEFTSAGTWDRQGALIFFTPAPGSDSILPAGEPVPGRYNPFGQLELVIAGNTIVLDRAYKLSGSIESDDLKIAGPSVEAVALIHMLLYLVLANLLWWIVVAVSWHTRS